LFPDDFGALARIWGDDEGYMFGVFFALMVSTGLRKGEARAIHTRQLIVTDGRRIIPMIGEDGAENPSAEQFIVKTYGLIIDRMFDSEGELVMHLKKGSDEENRKWRVVALPEKTVRYLERYLLIRPPGQLLFTYSGARIQANYSERRLARALKNAGISTENRKLPPHSLRYTYNTKMRRLVPKELLQMMIGHESDAMTDLYTRAQLDEQFLALNDHSAQINKFWETKKE
jgi:integrase